MAASPHRAAPAVAGATAAAAGDDAARRAATADAAGDDAERRAATADGGSPGARAYVALVGNREVAQAWSLIVAQALAVLNAPRGCEGSLHLVRHLPSGAEWVRHRAGADFVWHLVQRAGIVPPGPSLPAPRRAPPDYARWPAPCPRADLDN